MRFIPFDAVYKHQRRINAKIADAAGALRVADDKLGEAIKEYAGTNEYHEKSDMIAARLNARLFAQLLDDNIAPGLAPRVYIAIEKYATRTPGNGPHVEGAILALKLAARSLESALTLAEQLGADEIDARYQTPFAALGTIGSYAAALTCSALVFDDDDALDRIVAGKRTLAMAV